MNALQKEMRCADVVTDARLRLQSKLKINPTTGCLEWQYDRRKSDHGRRVPRPQIMVGKKRFLASHVAYALKFGSFPDGLYACHTCDNIICCNPDHIFPGTQSENMIDMMDKGRGNHPGVHGENHWNASVTWDVVRRIRSEWIPRVVSGAMLANKYGVPMRTVGHILAGDTWKE